MDLIIALQEITSYTTLSLLYTFLSSTDSFKDFSNEYCLIPRLVGGMGSTLHAHVPILKHSSSQFCGCVQHTNLSAPAKSV